jgi:16S rRNA (guanine966-N2)-methyltransferase
MARRNTLGSGAGKSPPGRVRIVAGKWRGRRLPVAQVPGLRPTSERVRETLFNWLAPRIAGARCLDLYAGTGALGFEALSREALEVLFVENSRVAARTIRGIARELGAVNARVHAGDAVDFLKKADVRQRDIVFLDPPFDDDRLAELCRLLAARPWLAPGAAVYLEQDRASAPLSLPEGWRTEREKCAGNVRFCLVTASGGAGHNTEGTNL